MYELFKNEILLFGSYYLRNRNHGRYVENKSYLRLDSAKGCSLYSIFHGTRQLLLEVYLRILKDFLSHYFLQNKGVKFVWSLKCYESFENLKKLLTMAPILKADDPY